MTLRQQGDSLHRYGFTVRHVRCDRCQDDYLPQHVHRVACRLWWCDNCVLRREGVGTLIEPVPRRRWHDRHSGIAA